MPITETLTATQQRALDHMRTHDGALSSGEGFTITTMRILERAGLITLTERRAADRILGSTRTRVFEAHLTDTGWGEHERPAPPAPRPMETFGADDVVQTLTGSHATVIRTGVEVTDKDGNHRTDGITVHGFFGYMTLTPEVLTLLERAADEQQTAEEAGPIPAEAAADPEFMAELRDIAQEAFDESDAKEQAERQQSLQEAQDEAQAAFDAAYPTEEPAAPQEGLYGAAGAYYKPGMRATFRTSDGHWEHGTVESVDLEARTVTLAVDSAQVAPPRRPMYPGAVSKPGRLRPSSGTYIRPADDKNLTPSKEQ